MHTPQAVAGPAASAAVIPRIRRLTVNRFRGIENFSWHPSAGVNLILGGGDVGKTTILDAIALLLSPTNAANLSDTDYFLRKIADEFAIEAVMTLPQDGAINAQPKPSWPWDWNGAEPVVPKLDDGGGTPSEPVYRFRVRGTADLELVYEILQPDGTADHFPVALRRAIGLVRLGGDDRNDRDLRLVQGSALDRLLSDKSLRSRMAKELAKTEVEGQLSPEGTAALAKLDEAFKAQSLPETLHLSITGSQGASVAALVGLTAACQAIQLPLASWGSGTRRLSALTIAEQKQGESPVTVVDEIERGLEPYRQHALMRRLQDAKSQAFVTTHSPAAIAAASQAAIWYVDHLGRIGPLDAKKIAKHRATDPNTFLSRLAIIGEGATEVGFASALLEAALGGALERHGVHMSDGVGHDNTLDVLQALTEGGLRFGGFADDEGKFPDRWKKLESALGNLLFRWESGCIEENMIQAVPDAKLQAFLTDPTGEDTGSRLRTLADRLGMTGDVDFALVAAKAGPKLKAVIIEAATGFVPADKADKKKEYKSHAQIWFKSLPGGRELAHKTFALGLWPEFRDRLLPFCNAVREALGLPPAPDVTL
jgi:putative ATP-dependent endonuclease of OLD family